MAKSAIDLIRVAAGQFGYVEKGGRDGKSGNITQFGAAYGLDGYAWCSMFVWWCFKQIGIDVRNEISGNYAGAEQAMRGFAAKGYKITKSPRPGDVAFFHFAGEPAGANHTGIVESVDSTGVTCIEGNTSAPGAAGSQSNGGGVYRRHRPFSVVIGYGRYPFPVAASTAPTAAPPRTQPVGPGKTYPTLAEGRKDMRIADVKRLQTLLHIAADGQFGPTTTKHVKQAQFNRHLVQDGIAGPATLKALGF